MDTGFIDHQKILDYLKETTPPDQEELNDILTHAKELKGISFEEAEKLLLVENKEHLEQIFETANYIKTEIYGSRLVLFAPLYISNFCNNECLYCGFKKSNTMIPRKTLTQEEIKREVEALVSQGHKRVLLVSGEGLGKSALDYTIESLNTIYSVKVGKGEIRRVNVNIAALEVEGFKRLKDAKIGTYQLFQETYHYPTYKAVHKSGPKSNYLYHLTAMDRAMEAGIDDIGVGILFGLADYKFELMALLQHIRHLEERFGFGVHTISVPRLEPATNSPITENQPAPVSDLDFKKIMAIIRITVPYTGMILSTRETAKIRREAFNMGISQISAGSRTNPGGYTSKDEGTQFSLGDHRSLDEVIRDVVSMNHIPSFCTACYRLGRTGMDFMDLAKPGLIKEYCLPNALTTFKEYLVNYGSKETVVAGNKLIDNMILEIPSEQRKQKTIEFLNKIEQGSTDLYF